MCGQFTRQNDAEKGESMATPKKTKPKLGTWKVKRVGENQITVTVPSGVRIQGDNLTIEDLLGAISNYIIVKKGRVLACCSGNIAIAKTLPDPEIYERDSNS